MNNNWLNKIQTHNATPPEGVWNSIANELDKIEEEAATSFAKKMFDFEVAPPIKVAKNIFATLDKAAPVSISERLYHYTEAAPTATWDNIAAILDKENETNVISIGNKKNKLRSIYISIAAAAAVITIISIAVINNNGERPGTIKETIAATIPQKQNSTPANIVPQKTITQQDISKANKEIKVTSVPNIDKGKIVEVISTTPSPAIKAYITINDVVALAQNPTEGNKEKLKDIHGETPVDIALMNTANTYISITGPDGQSVKVSSKFSNLISYLNDKNPNTKENIDVIIEESEKWHKTFSVWRDKMSSVAVAPSLSNFMDIIELSKILEEKK